MTDIQTPMTPRVSQISHFTISYITIANGSYIDSTTTHVILGRMMVFEHSIPTASSSVVSEHALRVERALRRVVLRHPHSMIPLLQQHSLLYNKLLYDPPILRIDCIWLRNSFRRQAYSHIPQRILHSPSYGHPPSACTIIQELFATVNIVTTLK